MADNTMTKAPVNQSPIEKNTPKTLEDYENSLTSLEAEYNKKRDDYLKQERAAGADWNPFTKQDKEAVGKIKADRKKLEESYKQQKAALEVERDKLKENFRTVTPKETYDKETKEKEEAARQEKIKKGEVSSFGELQEFKTDVANKMNKDPTVIAAKEDYKNGKISKDQLIEVYKKVDPINGENAARQYATIDSKGELFADAFKEQLGIKDKDKKKDTAGKGTGTGTGTGTGGGGSKTWDDIIAEQEKKHANMTDEDIKEMESQLSKYKLAADSNIDPSYIDNLPKDVIRAAIEGDFGKAFIDEDVKAKGKAALKVPKEKRTAEQNADIATYEAQKKEKNKAWLTMGNFLVNSMATAAGNIGQIFKGGSPTGVSQYQKVTDEKLRGGLERYNAKFKNMADNVSQYIDSRFQNQLGIKNTIEKVYADKTMQPYLKKMDLETQKLFVNAIASMDNNLKLRDLPKLAMNLLMYQDTGNILPSMTNAIGTGFNAAKGLLGGGK